MGKADQDNRANQLNPNNDAYHQSRGWESRDDASGADGAGERGKGWRSVYERYNSPPITYQQKAPPLFTFAEAAKALTSEINFYLPYALMSFAQEDPALVIDFTYLHCWQEPSAFKIIKRWAVQNREGFRRFTSVVVRFHGETTADFVKCPHCKAEHRMERGCCPPPFAGLPPVEV
jgi:hypothetical protein